MYSQITTTTAHSNIQYSQITITKRHILLMTRFLPWIHKPLFFPCTYHYFTTIHVQFNICIKAPCTCNLIFIFINCLYDKSLGFFFNQTGKVVFDNIKSFMAISADEWDGVGYG